MANSGVFVTKDRTKDFARQVDSLIKSEVLVGIPAENAGRDDGSAINNAEIGYIQENGSPVKNIPARPFLVPGVASVQDKVAAKMKAGAKNALDGDKNAASVTLNSVGLIAAAAVQRKIDTGPFVPLSPRTLYRRKHRKEAPRMGEQPLIDKGDLRRAIAYVIRPNRRRRRK
jgi:hypothetical protein